VNRRTVSFANILLSLEKPNISGFPLCGDRRVFEKGVRIGHTATGGKFLRRRHENRRALTTPIRGKPSNTQ
jgi:hypothetical protein